MTAYEKHLRDSFTEYTDEEIVKVLEAGNLLRPLTDHFDGKLLAIHVAKEELQRRSDSHLSLFFGL